MRVMAHRTRVLVAALAVATLVTTTAPASARIVEIGRTDVAPACPATPCVALSRTTGYQVKIADERDAFVVPEDGMIVAWTIALGKPAPAQISFFDKNFGGSPAASLTVLRQGKKLFSRAVAQSPVQQLTPYLGQVVQFPLDRALSVKKGYVIALTVPTWAPALTPLLSDQSAWRASRANDKCSDVKRQTAQLSLDSLTQYRCFYRARLI